jgi:hypothetical protein
LYFQVGFSFVLIKIRFPVQKSERFNIGYYLFLIKFHVSFDQDSFTSSKACNDSTFKFKTIFSETFGVLKEAFRIKLFVELWSWPTEEPNSFHPWL